MSSSFPESDWKIFREVREVALDRFSRSILDEVEHILVDSRRTNHERYLALYSLLEKRDRDLGLLFEGPRRSQMLLQLATLCSHGLLTHDDLSRFSEATRAVAASNL